MSVAGLRRRRRGKQQTKHAALFPSLPAVSSPQLFVRALFDYDPGQDPAVPCKEAAVAFRWGDVLQIVSAEDDAWWQARPQRDGHGRAGLVPSPQLHERWATSTRRLGTLARNHRGFCLRLKQESCAAATQSPLQASQSQTAR